MVGYVTFSGNERICYKSCKTENLKDALGQFILYRAVLLKTEPDRELYLAIRKAIYLEMFEEPIGKLLLESEHIRLIVFDPQQEVIVKWIP